MDSDDDFRFSVQDGCVVLEIFGDSDEEHNNDEESGGAEAATDDCGTESLATNGYSSDTSSLTVNSEIMTNKSNSAPPSRHSSLEHQIKSEVDLDIVKTEEDDLEMPELEKEFSDRAHDQLNKDNVICIKPEVILENLHEDSMGEMSSDDMYSAENDHEDDDMYSAENDLIEDDDMYSGENDHEDDDLLATKQALSLNELFKQYSKTPSSSKGKGADHLFGRDDTVKKSESQENLQLNVGNGVTEYIIETMPKNSTKLKIVETRSVSDVSFEGQHSADTDVAQGEVYDRKRPNLRRLPRINMSEDMYFDKKLFGAGSAMKGMNTQLKSDKAKRQMNSDRVQCDICEGWFAGTQSLSIHMRIHNNEKPYACNVCGWKSRTSSAHSLHIRLHSQDKQYSCSVCNMKFYTSSMLKSHYRVHSGEKPYKCPYCTDSFAHSSTLKVHIRQHTHERPYVCTVCNKRFTQPTHLTTHLRTHTQEKPFQCKYCGKRMRQSSHLKIHLRIHTQERPYDCDQCTANFMTKEHLVMHKRTHTGDHPYPCRVCGEAFTQSSARKKHERRHVEGLQHPCDICSINCISPRALKRHRKIHDASNLKTKVEQDEEVEEEEEIEEEEIEEEEQQELELETEPDIKEEPKPEPPRQRTRPKRKNPLQCDLCFKSFARKPNVTRHKMEIHAGFKRSTWAHTFVRNKFSKSCQYTT